MKRLIWLSIAIILALSSQVFFLARANLLKIENMTMNQSACSDFLFYPLTLLAREESLPPLGVTPDPNRDLGFVTLFVDLENKQEQNQTVRIQKVEILDVNSGQVQDLDYETEEILLRPLERSKIAIHLTNKVGFVGVNQVQAIVTVQCGDRVKNIESDPVNIERM